LKNSNEKYNWINCKSGKNVRYFNKRKMVLKLTSRNQTINGRYGNWNTTIENENVVVVVVVVLNMNKAKVNVKNGNGKNNRNRNKTKANGKNINNNRKY
jgi:hypothetical protein